MNDDSTIAAIREARHQISASIGHDPKKLVDYYRQLQQRFGKRVIPQSATEAKADDDNAA